MCYRNSPEYNYYRAILAISNHVNLHRAMEATPAQHDKQLGLGSVIILRIHLTLPSLVNARTLQQVPIT